MTDVDSAYDPDILNCSWHEFKRVAADFLMAAPTLNEDELDSAFKCITLAYFNLECKSMWQGSAIVVMEMATKAFTNREIELKYQGDWHE